MDTGGMRVAIVTGAGRGIGIAVARRFVLDGYAVAVVDLVQDRANDVASSLRREGGQAIAIQCDVAQTDQVEAMTRVLMERFGRIDVLVNCAGAYAPRRSVLETTDEVWDLVMDSNLKGTFLCIRAVLPHMYAAGSGQIINFSSNAGRSTATALGCEYTAAKAGVLGLTRHVAREAAEHGVRVNVVAPGPTDVCRLHDSVEDGEAATIAKSIPLGRLADPYEIASVVSFLASDDASFMIGATVDVNGGLLMM